MPHYLNLSFVLRWDFIVTYMMVVFFINWIFAMFRITKVSNGFRQIRESRNRQIHHGRA